MADAPFRPQAGIYLWGGPGTIRMIQLKEFHPVIDRAGLLQCYDREILSRYRDILGLTDVWATLSWGFSDDTEREDWEFLRARVQNFRASRLRVHAYVQGTNLVTTEHQEADYWCRDPWGHTIPYHRGRLLACPNNPAFSQLLLSRVKRACQLDVDGIYVDNFHMGQFAIPLGRYSTFFGCHCEYCRRAFRACAGTDIPTRFNLQEEQVQLFLRFRVQTMSQFAQSIQSVVHANGKFFGTNSFDATLDTHLTYGTDLTELAGIQDYLLLENYDHPATNRGNGRLQSIISQSPVPVCVISYRQAIGKHKSFNQADLDAVFSESQDLNYVPIYKGTEFTTRGRWHNLDPAQYQSVQTTTYTRNTHGSVTSSLPLGRSLSWCLSRVESPFLRAVYHKALARRLLGWIVVLLTTRRWPF